VPGSGPPRPAPSPAAPEPPAPRQAEGRSHDFTRRDALLAGGLTLAYAIVAYAHLGSTRAPQRCWNPQRAGETALLDLGSARALERVNAFVGVGQGSYVLELSADGREWAGRTTVEQPSLYEKVEWRVLRPPVPVARYLRVTAERPGALLCELAAYEGSERTPLPLAAAPAAEGTGAALLADEPGTAVRDPSFYDGMYFDEIFHARAAYELLHRLEPSETTHPPLGKAIIALGVATFGMTPFGWRFTGTLLGVAMVPLLYLFARRLLRRTDLAFFAAFLFAVDFMHFAQTRIATIDVHAVFFALLTYFFLHEYLRRDFWRAPLRALLLPLLGSGVAFGLGVACKWSVLYGAAGLALALLASLAARGREWLRARRAAGRGAGDADLARAEFPRRALAVVGFSALAFVAVPALLYLLSYVPFLLLPGPGHGLRDVLASQGHMYRYHAEMSQTHPFASPWWQWPLMIRPVWYYQGQHGLGRGMVSSIVAMGNPAVWWPGIAAVVAGLWLAVRRRDAGLAFVLAGLASQYLPWAIAPRKLVFMYHFFPSVPFVILAIAFAARALVDRHPAFRHLVRAHGLLALGLFGLFYPVLSGWPVPRSFVLHGLRWLGSWVLC